MPSSSACPRTAPAFRRVSLAPSPSGDMVSTFELDVGQSRTSIIAPAGIRPHARATTTATAELTGAAGRCGTAQGDHALTGVERVDPAAAGTPPGPRWPGSAKAARLVSTRLAWTAAAVSQHPHSSRRATSSCSGEDGDAPGHDYKGRCPGHARPGHDHKHDAGHSRRRPTRRWGGRSGDEQISTRGEHRVTVAPSPLLATSAGPSSGRRWPRWGGRAGEISPRRGHRSRSRAWPGVIDAFGVQDFGPQQQHRRRRPCCGGRMGRRGRRGRRTRRRRRRAVSPPAVGTGE